ncbi:hypothetical protein HOM50_02665 [bacterium]|jgi:hypothetical protein|nr:hypothetical protein [bacterium]MBT5015283.1 hypothetical protein [bacterium]
MRLNSVAVSIFTLTTLLLPFMSIAEEPHEFAEALQQFNDLPPEKKTLATEQAIQQIMLDTKNETSEKQISTGKRLMYIAATYGMGLLYAAAYFQVGFSPEVKELMTEQDALQPEYSLSSQPLVDLGTHTLDSVKGGWNDLKDWYYKSKGESSIKNHKKIAAL